MKIKNLFLSFALFFTACAPSSYWVKKGGTSDQFVKDQYDCRAMAGSSAGQNPFIYNSVFKDCMNNKYGYRNVSQTEFERLKSEAAVKQ